MTCSHKPLTVQDGGARVMCWDCGQIWVRAMNVDEFCREHKLSQREREVLRMSAGGMKNREVAKDLEVCIGTVATHWARIRLKTNLPSRHMVLAALMMTTR